MLESVGTKHDDTGRTFQLVDPDAVSSDQALLWSWQRMTAASSNLYAQYQSADWWEHLGMSLESGERRMLVMKAGLAVEGVIPLQLVVRTIDPRLPAALRELTVIPCADVLGSAPLLSSADAAVASAMLDAVFDLVPEAQGIYFKSIPQSSPWFELLVEAGNASPERFTHVTRDTAFHSLDLPDSFDAYLGHFDKKKRYNVKRQVRLMEEAYAGAMRVECITHVEQIEAFLATAEAVAAGSWKSHAAAPAIARTPANQARYADLARRGLLRAYTLREGERPVAYVLGYQYGDIYHYADIAYADSDVQHSPGSVLLMLIIEDLIANTRVRRLNFGIGDADYKRQFGNRHTRDRAVWIMRSTMRNRLICNAHVIAKRMARKISALHRKSLSAILMQS